MCLPWIRDRIIGHGRFKDAGHHRNMVDLHARLRWFGWFWFFHSGLVRLGLFGFVDLLLGCIPCLERPLRMCAAHVVLQPVAACSCPLTQLAFERFGIEVQHLMTSDITL